MHIWSQYLWSRMVWYIVYKFQNDQSFCFIILFNNWRRNNVVQPQPTSLNTAGSLSGGTLCKSLVDAQLWWQQHVILDECPPAPALQQQSVGRSGSCSSCIFGIRSSTDIRRPSGQLEYKANCLSIYANRNRCTSIIVRGRHEHFELHHICVQWRSQQQRRQRTVHDGPVSAELGRSGCGAQQKLQHSRFAA